MMTNALAARVRGLPAVVADTDGSVEVPRHLLERVGAALRAGETHYTSRPGLPELRRRLADEIARAGGGLFDPETDLIVTAGAREAIFVTLLALRPEPGSVVLTSDRASRHLALFRLMGLTPVVVSPGTQLPLDARIVYRMSGDGDARIEATVASARDAGLPELFDTEGLPGRAGRLPPLSRALTVLLGDLGDLPGLSRFGVGFVAGPAAMVRTIKVWKQAYSICTAAPSQRAAVAALESFETTGT